MTFFASGVLTAHLLHGHPPSLSTTTRGATSDALFLAASTVSLILAWAVNTVRERRRLRSQLAIASELSIHLLTGFSFSLALNVSRLYDPREVIRFLLLPVHPSFQPTLAFVACGSMPVLAVLYRHSSVKVKQSQVIDAKLLSGSFIFGVGWAMEGMCPGPAVTNLGRAFATRTELSAIGAWLIAAAIGGFFV